MKLMTPPNSKKSNDDKEPYMYNYDVIEFNNALTKKKQYDVILTQLYFNVLGNSLKVK